MINGWSGASYGISFELEYSIFVYAELRLRRALGLPDLCLYSFRSLYSQKIILGRWKGCLASNDNEFTIERETRTG